MKKNGETMIRDRDLFSVEGRVVVVTGASSGLGERFARRLGEAGARVVLAARRAERLEAISRDLPESVAVARDVTSEEDCHRLAEAALDRFGCIDVLVNNAGVSKPAPVEVAIHP
jgi:NADP-dependent 3-hydroxy acid dehydrogenase YdfG